MRRICLMIVILLLGLSQSIYGDSLATNLPNNEINQLTIFNILKEEKIERVVIETNLEALVANKRTNDYIPGNFIFQLANGQVSEKTISLKARGKSRRNYCGFPPLRIKFDGKELENKGWRNKHKSLKLVTHCNEGPIANKNVLKEYLAYKIYNELSPNSLRTKLLNVVYQDSESNRQLEKYALLLEDIDELAERLGGEEEENYGKNWKDIDSWNHQVFSTFQLLIGNADWDISLNRNVKFIQLAEQNKILVVPYDFDSSGFVAPSYAKPNPNFKLQSIHQRIFIGRIKNKQVRLELVQYFNSKKKNIYDLVQNFEQLDALIRLELIEYLDGFYSMLNDEASLDAAMPIRKKAPVKSDMEGIFNLKAF